MLRNRIRETYVLWIFGGNDLVIASSTSPAGPFKLESVRPSAQALLHKTGDFSFMIDRDEKAYVIYNSAMAGINIEQLAPDYLSALGHTNPKRYSSGVFGLTDTEAPVLFRRGELYYALFDHTCCVCPYGSGVGVYTAHSPLGPYTYRGQVGRDAAGDPATGWARDGHGAQQCWVMQLPSGSSPEFVWIGDRWGSAPDGLHGHDLTYWQPLEFGSDGTIGQFHFLDNFTITLGSAESRRSSS